MSNSLTIAALANSTAGHLELFEPSDGGWGYRLEVDTDCFDRKIGEHSFVEERTGEPPIVPHIPFRCTIESNYIFRIRDFPIVGNTRYQLTSRSIQIHAMWKNVAGDKAGFCFDTTHRMFYDWFMINPTLIYLDKPKAAQFMKMCGLYAFLKNDPNELVYLAERWKDVCNI